MTWLILALLVGLVFVGRAAGAGAGFSGGPGAFSSQTVYFAHAIARAEGTVNPDGTLNNNSIGIANNNPGDILNASGQLNSYGTLEEGWNALYNQAELMLYGGSRVYNPNMTIAQAGYLYTGGDNPTGWSLTVASSMGVSINTTLEQLGGLILS